MLEHSEGRTLGSAFTQFLLFSLLTFRPHHCIRKGLVGWLIYYTLDLEADSINKTDIYGLCSFSKFLQQRNMYFDAGKIVFARRKVL